MRMKGVSGGAEGKWYGARSKWKQELAGAPSKVLGGALRIEGGFWPVQKANGLVL